MGLWLTEIVPVLMSILSVSEARYSSTYLMAASEMLDAGSVFLPIFDMTATVSRQLHDRQCLRGTSAAYAALAAAML